MGKTSDINVSGVWDKNAHKILKEKSLSGKKITGCSYCYEQEEKNLRSRRLTNFELYEIRTTLKRFVSKIEPLV